MYASFFEKFSFENNKQINIDVWFPSNTYSILELSGACKKIKTALHDIFQCYDSFVSRGSGWALKKVLQFSITIMKYKLFKEDACPHCFLHHYDLRDVVCL